MVSANRHHLPSSSSKPLNPKNPNPNPDPNPNPSSDAGMKNPTVTVPDSSAIVPLSVDGSDQDAVLRQSEFLTREEVLRRRSRRLKQLAGYYRAQYWALMDEVRIKYREYYWEYGKSPCEEKEGGGWESGGGGMAEGSGENGHRLGLGFGEKDGYKRCGFAGCKTKAMALTSFCHQHILSDPDQKLYKACTYVVKSAQSGPVICGKPVIRAAVPALCTVHFQKAQRHVSQALKKAGFSGSSSNKPAPKFHVIIAEYVCQIQAKEKHRKQLLRMLWLRKNMSVKLSTYDPQMMQEHDMDVESTQILHMKKQICFNAVELFLVCGRISNCILLELLVDSTSDDIERSLCSDSAERNLHVIRVRTCQLSYDWPDMAGKCHGYGSEMDFTYKNEVIDTVQHQYVTCFEVFSYHSS